MGKPDNTPWIDAVAARSSKSSDEVSATLAKYGVVATPSLPPAPPLVLTSVEFSGRFSQTVRNGDPFTFQHTFDPRFNVFASDTNSTGKSSIQAGQGVPLQSFPEGSYRLEIKITDKLSSKVLTQNVNFTVAP